MPNHKQDFISYDISALTPVLNVRECVAGEGRLLGDMFMRRILYSFVTQEAKRAHGSDILVKSDKEKVEAEAEKLWKMTQRMAAAELVDITHTLEVILSDGTPLTTDLHGLA